MNPILELLSHQLSGERLATAANQVGTDPAKAGQVLQIALPLLMQAMNRNAATAEGAAQLHAAVEKDHDGSILEMLPQLLSGQTTANGSGILGHLLGGQQNRLVEQVAQRAGVDSSTAVQLMALAAPLLLGAVGKEQKAQGLDPAGLSSLLSGQVGQAQESQPGLLGTLNRMLDTDQDGSAIDDLVGMAGRWFKG
jgi:hypothetical protein